MKIEDKLNVLSRIAHRFNEARVTWAVGGSALLYLRDIADTFHDIDLMIMEEDTETVSEILLQMGIRLPSVPNAMFISKSFQKYVIDGVEVDVIAGFGIVKDGVRHDCSLQTDEITDYVILEKERIPLHSLAAWRRNYLLMDQPLKVRSIDDKTEKS
jgi:hypothetical protein